MLLVPLALAQDVVIRESLRATSSATTVHGGTFTGDGWRVDDANSRMVWDLGTQVERGTVSFVVDDVSWSNLTGDNNEFIQMFDAGDKWSCTRAVTFRVYGDVVGDSWGDIKLKTWDNASGLYSEARGGTQDWDGAPHLWTITWDTEVATLSKDGVELVRLDVAGQDLRVGTIWLPLNTWMEGSYSHPIGSVYSDLDFVGWEPGSEPDPPDDGDPNTLDPVEDVGAADWESGVFADESDLPLEASNERSYLMYDLSALSGTVSRATLRLNVRTGGSSGGSGGGVWAVSDTSWTEDTLTWSNKPSPERRLATFPDLAAGEHAEVDVTDGVRAGGPVAFAILSDGTDGLHLSSKEDGDPAVLTVELSDTPADTGEPAAVDDTGTYDDWRPREPRETSTPEPASCGCDAGASGAAWLALFPLLAIRRRPC